MGIRLSLEQEKSWLTGNTTYLGGKVKAIPGVADKFCEQPSSSFCDVDGHRFHLSTDHAVGLGNMAAISV